MNLDATLVTSFFEEGRTPCHLEEDPRLPPATAFADHAMRVKKIGCSITSHPCRNDTYYPVWSVMRMMRGLALIPVLLPMALAVGPSPSPTPSLINQYPFLFAYQLANNGNTIDMGTGIERNYAIDVSGLSVNLGCARSAHFPNISDIRVDLLKQGCARIVGKPQNLVEKNAEAQAKTKHLGIWAVKNTPTQSSKASADHKSASLLKAITRWIAKHKLISASSIGLLVAILASPWLIALVRLAVEFFHKRKVRILIAGIRSVGKTGLWIAWKNEYTGGSAGQISGLDPSVKPQQAKLQPIELTKWRLEPTLIDTPGAQPWHVINSIRRSAGPKSAARRARRVLLYVVAPCPDEQKTSTDPFDRDYVAKQEGYAHLPMAIIGQRDPRIRPDLVVMFANKFDLLSDVRPKDSNGTDAAQMALAFASHRELIEKACNEASVPFSWIIGSAWRDWGIDDLRKSLARVTN